MLKFYECAELCGTHTWETMSPLWEVQEYVKNDRILEMNLGGIVG